MLLIGFGVLEESVIKEKFVCFCGKKFFRLREDFVPDWFWDAEGNRLLKKSLFFVKKILSFKKKLRF